ncbi:MAG: siderophore-interacting protein [Pseudomonadota bacterium]
MTINAQTSVVLPEVEKSFARLVNHVSEHGIECDAISDSKVQFNHEGCSLEFSHDSQQLQIKLNAPTENMLYFLQEAAAAHVMEIDPVAGETLTWAGTSVVSTQTGTPTNFFELKLIQKREILSGIMRLTFSVDNLCDLPRDGLHVKLMCPKFKSVSPKWPSVARNGMTVWPDGKNELHVRYFTIRSIRLAAGEIDIDVVQHKGGMISDWAYAAKNGELVGIMGPAGGGVPVVNGEVLLVGDETALPAIARILEELPPLQKGNVVAPASDLQELHSYFPKTNLQYHSIERGRFRGECEGFVKALYTQDLTPTYAWFGGEFSNANSMRKIFKNNFGLTKGNQLSVSYWELGKRGAANLIE